MHPRHRSPGNGYRSSSMGLQISPEGSFRGRGMYNPDYRGFNRGFGRGQSKPFQPRQAPPRKGDVFMEAGRLATEYLVSKGLLPPNVLPGKSQDGSSKNQTGGFQGFRAEDGENLSSSLEGRGSALSRLGNEGSDVGSGRRRFPDDYNVAGSRSYMSGRRRTGSFKDYGSELTQEFRRSGPWSDKARASPDVEGSDDTFSGYREEQQVNKDASSGVQKSPPDELAPKSDGVGGSESSLEKYQMTEDGSSKGSSPCTGKDPQPEGDMKPIESSEVKISNMDHGEVDDCSIKEEKDKQIATLENSPIQHFVEEDYTASKNGNDVLGLSSFVKMPTRTRSSLTTRSSKVDTVPISDNENTHESGPPRGPEATVEENPLGGSSDDAPLNETQGSECLDSDILKAPEVQEPGELGIAYAVGLGKCTRSRSLLEKSSMKELESSAGSPGFGRCISMFIERGEKRAMEDDDIRDGIKKLREWAPSIDTRADDCLHLSYLREKQQTSQEGSNTPVDEVISATDHMTVNVSLVPKSGAEPCIEYAEEKQLFPGSFKTCDLNLMEASDVNENQNSDPLLIFPSVPENEKEAAPFNIDLSMSNKCNVSDKYGRHGANGKEIEVIDLETDSVLEDKAINNPERKDETVYTGLESFPNHAHNSNDIPDVQDGYGLMMTELLSNDIPNCSSVPADINFVDNDMGLHDGEGILGDDDSIYMSLGEIPTGFLRVWEHPTQEYDKPF